MNKFLTELYATAKLILTSEGYSTEDLVVHSKPNINTKKFTVKTVDGFYHLHSKELKVIRFHKEYPIWRTIHG